jgi:hypothetical protein
MITQLDSQSVRDLTTNVYEKLISGANPRFTSKNVFRNNFETVVEVIGNPLEVFEGIKRVVHNNKLEKFYGLEYGFAFTNLERLEFTTGLVFHTENLTDKYLWEQGWDVFNFNLDGAGYCFFDDTLTWIIINSLSIRFVHGNEDFMNSFYVGNAKQNEKNIFLNDYHKGMFTCPAHILDFVKP